MAKKPAARGKAPPPRGGAKPSNLSLNILIVLAGVVMVAFFLPTVILLGFAMLPTFVSMVVDRGPKRYGGMTVGGMNFARVSPYLLSLWTGPNDVPAALTIISDVFALLVIFGAAAIGWLLHSLTPAVMASFMSMTSQHRIAALRAKQQELIREWGPEVAQQETASEPGEGLDEAPADFG